MSGEWTAERLRELKVPEHRIAEDLAKLNDPDLAAKANAKLASVNGPMGVGEHLPPEAAERIRVESGNGSAPGGEQAGQSAPEDGPDEEKAPKRSQATELVQLATERYRLGCAEDGRPHAVALDGPNVALGLRGSRGLRGELASAYYAAHGKAPSAAALTDALAVLEGDALAAEREPVALRVGRDHGRIVLDLGDQAGRCAIVSAGGWHVTKPSPVLFRRSALTGALPEPEHGGSLEELRRLVNVSDAAWPVLVGWLVASLLPELAHAIALLTGEEGTGKTTAASLLGRLVDPSPAQVRSAPRDVEQWCLAASGSWVVVLDNLTTILGWLSDCLCRAVTGNGLVRRLLYSDDELTVVFFRRCVILTAIDAGSLKGDLASRIVTVELERIGPEARMPEEELLPAYEAAHGRILGALLDLLAKVLAVLPTIKLDCLPRMADFAKVLAAVDQVTGWTSLVTYLAMGTHLAEEVVEGDALAVAVRGLAEREGAWAGTAGELLEKLGRPEHPPRGWPATPRALGGALKRAAPTLRAVGVSAERSEREAGTGRRIWTVTRTDGDRDEPSQSSQPSRQPSDQGERRDSRCDGSAGDDATVTGTVTTPQGAEQGERAGRDVVTVVTQEHGPNLFGSDGPPSQPATTIPSSTENRDPFASQPSHPDDPWWDRPDEAEAADDADFEEVDR